MMSVPSTHHFDVVVVGAGPGGSTAALGLARAGLKVALVDKADWPRYKTCGGGLVPRTLALLPLDLRHEQAAQCNDVALHHHDPSLAFRSRREGGAVRMVMRSAFDAALAAAATAAGVQFFKQCGLRGLARSDGHWQIEAGPHSLRGRWLVAADGVASAVATLLKLPKLRDIAPALEVEIDVEPAHFTAFSGTARFDFGLTPAGYGWVFPKTKHLSVGVLTTQPGSCNLNTEYRRYLASLGVQPSNEERHGYLIPLRPRDRLFDTPGVLLVGDAAGLADPVTAEGIGAAVWSGQLAAQAIAESPSDEAAVRTGYRERLESALLRDLRVARRLARVLYQCPRLRNHAFRRHGQRLADFMMGVVSGEARYSDLTLRRMVAGLFR